MRPCQTTASFKGVVRGAAALFGPRRNAAWASALRSPLWGYPQASLRFAQPPSDWIRIDRLTCGRQIVS